jgi:hypothetical protein
MNESVVAYPLPDHADDGFVDWNRMAAEANDVLNASCVIDLMKLPIDVEAGEDVICE